MAGRSDRMKQPSSLSGEMAVVGVLVAAIAAALATFWLAMVVGGKFAGQNTPNGIPSQIKGLTERSLQWTGWHTTVAIGLWVVLGAVAIWATISAVRRRNRRARVDGAARHMASGREIERLSLKSAQAVAARLGVKGDRPGIRIGRTVRGNMDVWAGWEDLHIHIWGPRRGKSTSQVIPAIIEAPGAVVTTSNKRDVVDATRDVRAEVGTVWIFDPQQIAQEKPTWFWNILSFVTDENKADELADHFVASVTSANSRGDAFFENRGKTLLTSLLLAAATDGGSILDVYKWLTNVEACRDAVDILEQAGYQQHALGLRGDLDSPDKQRGGVFSTAESYVACLRNTQIHPWIQRMGPHDRRPEFDPDVFVSQADTLYSLSREGSGNASAIVAALTWAIADAGERLSMRSPQGRLARPLLLALDEVANCARIRQLPNVYSHWGSRGIIVIAVLQSWSQGVEVWGQDGMRKLWSAANVKVYGGGVAEKEFLADLSAYVGEHERLNRSVSSGRGGGSASVDVRRETTLGVDDLQALDPFRALVLASGCPPVLIKTIPWMESEHADGVKASIAAHDPAAQKAA